MAETNAERLRRLRAAAVDKGLCYVCRCRPRKPGTRSCAECIAFKQATKDEWKRTGRCVRCGAPRGASSSSENCDRCRVRANKRATTRKGEAADVGLCTRCKAAPALFGKRCCAECAEKFRLSKKATALALAGGIVEARHCSVCGSSEHNALFHRRASTELEVAPGSAKSPDS